MNPWSMEDRVAILASERPPQIVIDEAVRVAQLSPCAKSKRGVVIYNNETAARYAAGGEMSLADIATFVTGRGFNGPPSHFGCLSNDACRSACGQVCIHAEDRAIRDAGILDDVHDLILVHVKVVNSVLVAGGPPSCWQCSRVIAEVGVKGVWLLEAQRWHDELRCQACRRLTIVPLGEGTTGVCNQCDHVGRLLEMPGRRVYDGDSGKWRYRTAVRFHAATLHGRGLPYSYQPTDDNE